MAPAPLLTTDEYLRTPETLRPMELIFGAMRVADAPAVRHQQAVGAFHLALAPHVRDRGLGRVLLSPVDVILDWNRGLILQPDLVFVSHERWRLRQERLVGAPDMVLEVLSPQPRIGKLDERLRLFAQYGVREVWLFWQLEERFEVHHVSGGVVATVDSFDYFQPIRSAVLPDFRMALADVLQE